MSLSAWLGSIMMRGMVIDCVTQYEGVATCERISEALLQSFPFVILGFHSDNGSEYINHQVAKLLNELLIEEHTKSRSRHSNGNAQAESKTGARDSALASFKLKLKHLDLEAGFVFQDARKVNTKASKTFTSYFFPVGDDILSIVREWVEFLQVELLFGLNDPLFPKTEVKPNASRVFEPVGLSREHSSNANPIRGIFKSAFERAGLTYFNPHSFRKTLVRLGETTCRSPVPAEVTPLPGV